MPTLLTKRVKNGENILTKEISEEDANLIEERVALQQKQVQLVDCATIPWTGAVYCHDTFQPLSIVKCRARLAVSLQFELHKQKEERRKTGKIMAFARYLTEEEAIFALLDCDEDEVWAGGWPLPRFIVQEIGTWF